MVKRLATLSLLVGLLLLAFALPVAAGGAATVNLDELPTEVHANQPLHLTFTIWQHGQHLVDEFSGVGPVTPYLEATHPETGETLRVEAYKPEGGEEGHFAVDVTFPRDGVWNWQIYPEPFGLINQFEPLTVQPELAPVSAAVSNPNPTSDSLRALLRWGGGAALVGSGAMLLLARRRQPVPRPLVADSR